MVARGDSLYTFVWALAIRSDETRGDVSTNTRNKAISSPQYVYICVHVFILARQLRNIGFIEFGQQKFTRSIDVSRCEETHEDRRTLPSFLDHGRRIQVASGRFVHRTNSGMCSYCDVALL